MSMLKYCTKCDRDVLSICGTCGNTTHIIERDSDEKCAACGEEWGQHGNGSSASACKGGTTSFTPLPSTPHGILPPVPTPTIVGVDYAANRAAPTPTSNGMSCAKCGDFNDYGTPNVGSQFICYLCRKR